MQESDGRVWGLEPDANKVHAVTLRPGYNIILYSEDNMKGEEEVIIGQYDKYGALEEKTMCQVIKSKKIRSNVGSIRIVKHGTAGKATGYWKGITSTNAQKYEFQVGITSTDGTSSA